MYEAQYKHIKDNKEKYAEYARKSYHKRMADPDKRAAQKAVRNAWYEANKADVLIKQRDKKRQRKLDAINYLGGVCKQCHGTFHPAIFEFHHRDPTTKDADPSKLFNRSWERILEEIDKCDLLCANCHRLIHHTWENE